MNIWDYLVLGAILLAVVFAVRHIRRNRGKSCSCGCSDCGRCPGCTAGNVGVADQSAETACECGCKPERGTEAADSGRAAAEERHRT